MATETRTKKRGLKKFLLGSPLGIALLSMVLVGGAVMAYLILSPVVTQTNNVVDAGGMVDLSVTGSGTNPLPDDGQVYMGMAYQAHLVATPSSPVNGGQIWLDPAGNDITVKNSLGQTLVPETIANADSGQVTTGYLLGGFSGTTVTDITFTVTFNEAGNGQAIHEFVTGTPA